jgi:eukaryotic-like serine/threonine-protein kinase
MNGAAGRLASGFTVDVVSADELLCGRYALRGVLGRGGMAEVRDGWDSRLGRAIAVKVLHPWLAADTENRLRFEAEARSAAALSHPNIVAIHDSGEDGGTPFIVMERLPGHTLADLIARGPLPQPMVRAVLAEVLAALAVAHQAGILHRDIKPGNILFTSSGMAKVADFGIAKTTETNHTVAGQIVGTVAYLSPERLTGKPATPADDLYAVGAVGYEALTGRRAYPQDTLGSLSQAIMTQRPPALAALRPEIDPALAALVERAMEPRGQWRFGSATEMLAALSGRNPGLVGAPRPSTMVMTSPLPPMPPAARGPAPGRRTPMSRTRKLVALAAGLLAVIITATAFIVDSWTHPTPMPSAPATTTSTTNPTTSAISTTPSLPPTNPPKRHGHGKGHNGGED